MLSDELFAFLHPYRDQYPADYRNHFLQDIQRRFYSEDQRCFVVELNGNVVGLACWRASQGRFNLLKDCQDSQPQEINWLEDKERPLEIFPHDRSASPTAYESFHASRRDNPFPPLPPCLYLAFLVVDPMYQRKGLGAALMEWGLLTAKREDVPIGLRGSRVGTKLYRKLGFEDVEEVIIVEGVAYTIMVWRPEKQAKGQELLTERMT